MALLGGKFRNKKKLEGEFVETLLVKRCPECFINLPLDAKECFSCHTRVGKIDKEGKAKKSVDWVSYIICILSWAVFFIYIKWAFKL
jgi:hypothetical protein